MRAMLQFAAISICSVAVAFAARADDYVAIEHAVTVGTSADAVWRRIGDFCAVSQFSRMSCQMVSGSGGVGSVRRVGNDAHTELLEARTSHSYTYEGGLREYDVHGTLAVEPSGGDSAQVIYTVVYDQSQVSEKDRDQFHERFDNLIQQLVAGIKDMFAS